MTKYDALIRFADEPMKMIKWFTKNYDKEIGALGIGDVKEGEMYVERLIFPTQIVNGTHVNFKPEDWGPIIKELSEKDIGRICFYWHKHPGSASASQGDEDETFDVFMPEDTDRKIFGFMQTAEKHNGDFEYEARIELRDPICCSIEGVQITTDTEDEMGEVCEQIIKDKITVGYASAKDQPGMVKGLKKQNFEIIHQKKYDGVPNVSNSDDDDFIFELVNKNGCLIIDISMYLAEWIVDCLEGELFTNYVRKYDVKPLDETTTRIKIQPQKKCIKKLFTEFKAMKDEMTLSNEDVMDNSQTTLESTIQQDVYTEEADIAASQCRGHPQAGLWDYQVDRSWYRGG